MENNNYKPKKKPTKIEEMSKEQIRQAILIKRECNMKAQQIVESLLETNVSETYFLECLPDINQSHFDDVIEERSIIHLCAYPLCHKNISERDIPKQKYRISVKTNKVYDITARKNFCSNTCYNAAMYIKKQMLTSPLWFREYEEIPTFQLLPMNSIGSLGQEVDVAIIEKLGTNAIRQPSFTSINDFASASILEVSPEINIHAQEIDDSLKKQSQLEKQTQEDKTSYDHHKNPANKSTEISISHSKNVLVAKSHRTALEKTKVETKTGKENKKLIKKPAANPMNIVGEIVEKPERMIDPILTDVPHSSKTQTSKPSKSIHKKQPSLAEITIEVEKCLAEWFTLDTMLFLFGEDRVKEMVAHKGECIKDYLNNYAKQIFYTSNTYDQYQALCRKLNLLELEDRKKTETILQKDTKPLPDYSIIQEESKKMQLKVRAFFSGETFVPDIKSNDMEKMCNQNEDASLTQLPLVDKNAQNALRRKIVCQHLNKVLPDLLRSLGLLSLSISADVRLLVNTFKLQANNIMFKPIQWTLIAIIIIKLLSLRDAQLHYLLEQQTAFRHMQLLLLSFKQQGGYLDRLISWLTDVDRLLDTNDTQLTIQP